MKRVAVLALVAACAVLSTDARAQQAASGITVYEGALVIPGNGSGPLANAAFVVQNGAIVSVGPRGAVAVPAGAAHVDLSGRTVMPALINAHGHPGFQRGLTYGRQNYTRETYLDDLNRAIVERLQSGGEAFVSNAVVDGKQALRACVVNFRTTRADVEALPEIVARIGRAVDRERRP